MILTNGRHGGTLLGRVKAAGSQNPFGCRSVVPCMGPISNVHMEQPGLAVVEIAAYDDQTAFAVQELLAARWPTSTADRTTRDPGQSGVRLPCYLDVRQEINPQH